MSDLSRRSLVAAAASLPALAIPALASPDPALTAVDRHNTALDALCAFEAQEPDVHSPVYWLWDERHVCLGDQSWSAYRAMLGTPPTTNAGAAAAIRALLEYEAGTEYTNEMEVAVPLLKGLLAYLEGAPP